MIAPTLIAQSRAELLKIRSTRTTFGIVLGMIGLILLFSLLAGLVTSASDLSGAEDQRGQLSVGSLSGIFSALAGLMLITSEYRHGTIRPTFLFMPRRSRLLAAKVAAGLAAGAVFGIVGEGLGFGIGYLCLSARGIPFVLDSGDVVQLVLGTIAAVGLWGAIGVGLGAIVRSQVGGIIGLLVWGLVIENVLFGFVPWFGRFGPAHAQDALAGLSTDHLLPAAAGGAVLVAWTVGLVAAGVALAARRDVN